MPTAARALPKGPRRTFAPLRWPGRPRTRPGPSPACRIRNIPNTPKYETSYTQIRLMLVSGGSARADFPPCPFPNRALGSPAFLPCPPTPTSAVSSPAVLLPDPFYWRRTPRTPAPLGNPAPDAEEKPFLAILFENHPATGQIGNQPIASPLLMEVGLRSFLRIALFFKDLLKTSTRVLYLNFALQVHQIRRRFGRHSIKSDYLWADPS